MEFGDVAADADGAIVVAAVDADELKLFAVQWMVDQAMNDYHHQFQFLFQCHYLYHYDVAAHYHLFAYSHYGDSPASDAEVAVATHYSLDSDCMS